MCLSNLGLKNDYWTTLDATPQLLEWPKPGTDLALSGEGSGPQEAHTPLLGTRVGQPRRKTVWGVPQNQTHSPHAAPQLPWTRYPVCSPSTLP